MRNADWIVELPSNNSTWRAPPIIHRPCFTCDRVIQLRAIYNTEHALVCPVSRPCQEITRPLAFACICARACYSAVALIVVSSVSRFPTRAYSSTFVYYFLHTQNNWRLGQRHGLQNTILTSYFYKKIYQKMIYVYFHKSIFQDKSIHIIFIFSNSTTWELFMIYILKIWLKPCPKHQVLWVWREYLQQQ